jgi:uncharacterized protein YkwD
VRATIIAVLSTVMLLASVTAASAGMNRIEYNSAKLVNVERRDAGVSTVTRQSCLQRHAEVHANRMAAKGKIYHRTSSALRTVMKRCKLTSIGENLASGTRMTSVAAVDAWMRSPGHRRNLLNPSFNRIGAAYATDAGGRRYWIQLYGRH